MKNKYIPMLYSTDMVQAIMSDTKLETRRIVKYSKKITDEKIGFSVFTEPNEFEVRGTHENGQFGCSIFKKPINKGDIIWVRESYYAWGKWIKNGTSKTGKQKYIFNDLTLNKVGRKYHYLTDVFDKKLLRKNNNSEKENIEGWYKRNSLFMPKKACRIFLEVVSVSVERLQDIDEQGAINEGVDTCFKKGTQYYKEGDYKNYTWHGDGGNDSFSGYSNVENAKQSFQSLWHKINGKDSWDKNPFVWVYKFERTEKPLDFI